MHLHWHLRCNVGYRGTIFFLACMLAEWLRCLHCTPCQKKHVPLQNWPSKSGKRQLGNMQSRNTGPLLLPWYTRLSVHPHPPKKIGKLVNSLRPSHKNDKNSKKYKRSFLDSQLAYVGQGRRVSCPCWSIAWHLVDKPMSRVPMSRKSVANAILASWMRLDAKLRGQPLTEKAPKACWYSLLPSALQASCQRRNSR